MKKTIMILIAVFAFCITGAAQNLKAIKGKVSDGYNFWLSTPKGASAEEKKPVVIFLHGASLKGNDLNKVLKYGTLDAMSKGLDLDAYVIAPQTQGAWNPKKVMNVLDYVIANNPGVDTTRVYVIGMSLGGYGTIDVAANYHDRIAAAMAICGGGTAKELGNLNNLPLWIIHGTADKAVSIKESDKVVEKMKAQDAQTMRLIYTRVPGMNHSEPARLLYMPAAYKWLFEHSLNDENRNVAKGFPINKQSLSNVYREMRGARVSAATKVINKDVQDDTLN